MRRQKPFRQTSLIHVSMLMASLIVPGAAAGQGLDRASLEALAKKTLPATARCNSSGSEVLCWYEQDDVHAMLRGGRGHYYAEADGSPAIMVVVSYNDRSAGNDARSRLLLDVGNAFGYASSDTTACLDRAKQVMGSKQGADRNEAQNRLPKIRRGTYELHCDFEMPDDQPPYTHRSVLIITASK